jgi:uncharacterized membrane protein
MSDKRLLISIFDAESDADEAAAALQHSGAIGEDAMGVLVLDEHGKLKTHKIGATSGGKGAGAGLVLGLLGPVGIGIGTAGGAILGKLHHKDLGLDDADKARLGGALRGGKAALAVLADPQDLVPAESILKGRGGTTEAHDLDEAVVRAAAEDAEAAASDRAGWASAEAKDM